MGNNIRERSALFTIQSTVLMAIESSSQPAKTDPFHSSPSHSAPEKKNTDSITSLVPLLAHTVQNRDSPMEMGNNSALEFDEHERGKSSPISTTSEENAGSGDEEKPG